MELMDLPQDMKMLSRTEKQPSEKILDLYNPIQDAYTMNGITIQKFKYSYSEQQSYYFTSVPELETYYIFTVNDAENTCEELPEQVSYLYTYTHDDQYIENKSEVPNQVFQVVSEYNKV